MDDYRRINKEDIPTDIILKKQNLKKLIKESSCRIRNYYLNIRRKDGFYYKEFAKIYNNSCVYCGIDTSISSIKNFEIDHVKCESSFKINNSDEIDHIKAGQIENLAFSCRNCNHNKSNFILTDNFLNLLDIDNNGIINIFMRDNDFRIVVHRDFKNNKEVYDFYEKLELGSEMNRLLYLIYKMDGYKDKIIDSEVKLMWMNETGNLRKKFNLM